MSVSEPGVDIYVINLDRSPDRLAFQTEQLRRLGLVFTRLPAVDGALIDEATYRRHAYLWERPLSRTEVGCALSHRRCWEMVAETGRNALILEDDAVLGCEIRAFLAESGRFGEPVVINVETRSGRRWLGKRPSFTSPGDGYELFELMLGVGGTTAYFLTPAAAAILRAGVDRSVPVADAYIWNAPKIVKLQSDPGLVLQLVAMEENAPWGAGRTTITKPSMGHLNSMAELLRHPRLRLRRVSGQLRLAARKLMLARRAITRVVPPSPSIARNYLSIRGIADG